MFAPPPVQMSRMEIEQKKESEAPDAMETGSPNDAKQPPSLLQKTSQSPTSSSRWNHPFGGKGDKNQAPSPIATQSRGSSPAGRGLSQDWNLVRATREALYALSPGFGENPRLAPSPPKRTATRPKDLWLPPLPGSFPDLETTFSEALAQSPHTPSTTLKSPTNQSLTKAQAKELELSRIERALGDTVSDSPTNSRAMPSMTRAYGDDTRRTRSADVAASIAHGRGNGSLDRSSVVKGSRIEKGQTPNRRSIYASGSNSQSVLDRFRTVYGDSDSPMSASTSTPQAQRYPHTFKQHTPSRLSFANRALPDTPVSIGFSPTELYQNSSRSPSSIGSSPRSRRRRSPLSQISSVSAKNNGSPVAEMDISPSRLSAIPEHSNMYEKSALSSEVSTPISTRIHLRGGSVLTLDPPELTAWQRSVYVQGPIKLLKPTVGLPGTSVASLEPFSEAIDDFCQEAQYVPRRKSEDQVLDEICVFFDDFGFGEMPFTGDALAATDLMLDEVTDWRDEHGDEAERFSTPPIDPEGSTVGEEATEDMEEATAKPPPIMNQSVPPVENEETLRAKDIASLGRRRAHAVSHARGDSATVPQALITLQPFTEPALPEASVEREDEDGAVPEDHVMDDVVDIDDSAPKASGVATPADEVPVLELKGLSR